MCGRKITKINHKEMLIMAGADLSEEELRDFAGGTMATIDFKCRFCGRRLSSPSHLAQSTA
jgi:hypothetical protein